MFDLLVSDEDVACRLGVSAELARDIDGHVMSLFFSGLTQNLVDIAFEAYISADQMGLLNIRLDV